MDGPGAELFGCADETWRGGTWGKELVELEPISKTLQEKVWKSTLQDILPALAECDHFDPVLQRELEQVSTYFLIQ